MGRPPLGKVPMTAAERQRRRRAKLGHAEVVTKRHGNEAAELQQARARIAELEAEVVRLQAELSTLAKPETEAGGTRTEALFSEIKRAMRK
jgi:hypothetical protein